MPRPGGARVMRPDSGESVQVIGSLREDPEAESCRISESGPALVEPDPTSPTSVTCDPRPLHDHDTYSDP